MLSRRGLSGATSRKSTRANASEKHQEQHESDVDRPEDLRGDHGIGRVEVEQGHRHRDRGQGLIRPTLEVAGGALLLFDEFLGLAPSLFVDERVLLDQGLAGGHESVRRTGDRVRPKRVESQ